MIILDSVWALDLKLKVMDFLGFLVKFSDKRNY